MKRWENVFVKNETFIHHFYLILVQVTVVVNGPSCRSGGTGDTGKGAPQIFFIPTLSEISEKKLEQIDKVIPVMIQSHAESMKKILGAL